MLEPGDTIDIWVVEAALGSGGMGSVYRCHNRNATRIMAAVKVLEGGLRRYPEAEARFVREAEILFQLDHPNIVKVRNVRTETEPPYLEMEFVAGESLDERLRRGPLPYAEALDHVRQCVDAVAYLHAKGIRHRDIKPANVLVQKDGRVKLVDFGLAVEQDHTRITQAGMAFGTVSYAPPEWIAPETLDPVKWDIYALGVVFYEMLTGRFAFPVSGSGTARQQAMQVIIAKQNHPPLDPGPSFHDDVRQLIADMTRSDAASRASDAAALVARTKALVPTLRGSAGVTLAPTRADAQPSPTGFDSTPTPAPTVAIPEPAGTVRPLGPPRAASDRGGRLVLAAFGGLGALLVAGALLAIVLAAGLYVWATRPPEPRAVDVVEEVPEVGPAPAVVPAEVEPAPVPVPEVEPAPARVAPAPEPTPKPKPAAPRPAGRGLVTVGELAAWLEENAEYAPGGPFATKGGPGYLRGWTAAGPPPERKAGEPVTGVSAALAIEFCKQRGGLPDLDAEPKVPATAYEVRVDGNAVRLLENLGDGTARAVPTDAVRATSGASFRCAR